MDVYRIVYVPVTQLWVFPDEIEVAAIAADKSYRN